MKLIVRSLLVSLAASSFLAASTQAASLTSSLTPGKPELKSAGPIAFGPEGILFVADPQAATLFAIATGDTEHGAHEAVKVEGINQKVAALLGTSADQLLINDLAVNPASHTPYLSVSRGRGPDAVPVLIQVKSGGKLAVLSLENIPFAKAVLPDAPADQEVGEGRRSNPRRESITDIAFKDGRLIVAGLSNEEFASSLRAIPFPFKDVSKGTSVEIYHGAHGQFETRSPIRTFLPYDIGGNPHLLAAYTCTPLVRVPMSDLKPGVHVKGTTIAELGNRNRPLDMIAYQKGGKDYILMANSSRGIMKIATDALGTTAGIVERVEGDGKKGVGYETIESWQGIDQLDQLDSSNALVVRRADNGSVNLESLPLP